VLAGADQLLEAGKFEEAEAEIRRAEGLPGGPCGECGLGLAMVSGSQGKWDESIDRIQRSLPLLTAPTLLARAYNQLGIAYVKSTAADRLAKAEEALRNSADYGGFWGDIAHRNLAQVLLLEEHWAEAAETAREALAKAGTDKEAARAARIILCQARSHISEDLPQDDSVAMSTTGPLKVGEGVSRPEKIAGPPPQYTQEAREARTEGTVVVESVIDREGCVRQTKVIQGQPNGLSESALETLRLWVFSPAMFQGKPVSVLYTLSVNFKVEKTPPK
jgi:TonB family protein